MKIVVIGGTGLVGRLLVSALQQQGHETVVVARSRGIDVRSGKGLAFALHNADVVVDTSNPGYGTADGMLDFFQACGTTLLAAERGAGVAHHVLLSAMGTDVLRDTGYFRAKHAQETLVRASGLPYTILRSTPFFEFIYNIVDAGGAGSEIRLPPLNVQPVAALDVASALARVAIGDPCDAVVELAGPTPYQLGELAETILVANEDMRDLKVDPAAHYFGGPVGRASLVGSDVTLLSARRFDDWLRQSLAIA